MHLVESMAYVGAMMLLMARPVMAYFLWRVFGERGAVSIVLPIVIALTVSVAVAVIPLALAERRLTRIGESD